MSARSRPRVLVIDDEDPIRDLLVEYLEMRGYDAEGAATAGAGLALMRERPADLVVLDVNLPGAMSGVDAVPNFARAAAVVVVSGTEDADLARATVRRGAFGYVTKPFELERFLGVVEAALLQRGTTPP
ncbi:MAG: response regulator [Candidatus Rokubacteria bacterium]|nr:response regulator [Candidatus Rokubacteria bacterium]